MLAIGLYFCRAFIVGLSTRGPNRRLGSIVHLECFSSIDEQARIDVGELVFVR